MTFLSDMTIRRLVKAACDLALEGEALVELLPPEVRSALGSRPTSVSQLLMVVGKLNTWKPRSGEEPPLCTFLKNAVLLSEGRAECQVFETALAEVEASRRRDARQSSRPLHDALEEVLAEVEERSRHDARPPPFQVHDVYMKRAKRFYASHGYDVDPPDTVRSAAFLAYRGVGIVQVIAVADDSVEEAIHAVTQLVQRLLPNEPLAEGYVVLTSTSPEKLKVDELKVRDANLRPMPYSNLPPIGTPDIEKFVSRQHACLLAEDDPPDLCDGDVIDAPLEELSRSLLSDRNIRVLVLHAGSGPAIWHARKRIAHACSEDFDNKPNAPAPIILTLAEPPKADLKDLVAEVFRFHDVRFSPIALLQLLEDGALLPIFASSIGGPSHADLELVKQAVLGKAKVVLLGCEEDATSIRRLAQHLNVPAKSIRVVTPRGGRSPGALPM